MANGGSGYSACADFSFTAVELSIDVTTLKIPSETWITLIDFATSRATQGRMTAQEAKRGKARMNVDLSPAIVQLGYFVWGWLGPYYSNEPRILTQSSTKQYLMGA